jgi:hypothetical protein
MLMFTSACWADELAVVDGVLVSDPLGVVDGAEDGALVGVVLGEDPLVELPLQPASTSTPRAGRRANAVPRENVERMMSKGLSAGRFQTAGRGTHPLA